jgi:Lysozyme like domain/Ricin-type beta-trefoil lectin domain
MRGVTVPSVPSVARLLAIAAAGLVLVGSAANTGASDRPAPPVARIHLASLAPHGAAGPMTFQQVATAAQTCAGYAAAAGWANNGTYGGNLVTAAAVCVAESGGNPAIYYCDGTGRVGTYPLVTCPGGSYDRGLWQVNSKAWPKVTDACAFQPSCNADAAYAISARGATFSPWVVYDSTGYTRYLGAAQAAVNRLGSGALVSAVFGVCATRAGAAAGTAVVAGACGQSLPAQQWTSTGGTLRSGTLCLTAGTGQPAVTASTCNGGASQAWTVQGTGQLRNGQTGLCLRDARRSHPAGTPLGLASCAHTRAKTWWLP